MKILISLVGTGKLARDAQSSRYITTDYLIEGKLYQSETFVASAIIKHYEINKVFFIGTNQSMWDEIGNTFGVDDDICVSCYEKQNNENLTEEDLFPVTEAINKKLKQKGSKCIIIKEGVNDNELLDVFNRFVKILDLISDSDELYLDITHLFRSLSVMALVMSEFGLSYKRFKLKGVFYGQLSDSRHSTVINLVVFLEFLKWSKAIRDLNLYGNGHGLDKLLQNSDEPKEIKTIFKNFSNALSIADMGEIQESVKLIKKQINLFEESKNPIIKIISKQLINFIKRFDASDSLSKFQFDLTEWYAENNNYAMAYITLVEAAISARCEITYKDSTDRNNREEAKDSLKKIKVFKKVNNIRNNIAHKISAPLAKQHPKDAISNFNRYYSALKNITA
ncbi:MAG: TIGR02221 family CRISPR-associated protein [Campylobacteraceae bacterium]|jgi:CRISPR-associated Csx2 family protein|nr:TIGR02221 family CRISPR-associated protein [Campylobacteraceae bacterium]